jgi:quercetin dioxygenase-like cupin family protein
VLPGEPLDATVAFFIDTLGFRVDEISPADEPATIVLSGHGLRVRLDREHTGPPGTIRLVRYERGDDRELTAPNGTRIVFGVDGRLDIPPLEPALTVARIADASWGDGRAGMRYRDLIPGRQGGRFIASHIHIAEGGPVPDYVHYHHVRFQMIYCYRGWVRVAYEDQGPPLVLREGDCLVQPPLIRHRVLESSPDLHVVELACPARHDTYADHELELPTAQLNPDRVFEGQRFTHHVAADATWKPWHVAGFEARDTGLLEATGGVVSVRVARVADTVAEPSTATHDSELWFAFVLDGSVTVTFGEADDAPLVAGDAIAIPAGTTYTLTKRSTDLHLLEVQVPTSA